MNLSNIVLSANNNEDVFVLPVVPEIEVDKPQHNQDFETIDNGWFCLIGKEGLRTFSLASILPCREYAWMKPGSIAVPFRYIDFINKWRSRQYPFRIIVSRPDGREWFNMPVVIDDFSFSIQRNGNIKYVASFREYRFIRGV